MVADEPQDEPGSPPLSMAPADSQAVIDSAVAFIKKSSLDTGSTVPVQKEYDALLNAVKVYLGIPQA